MQPRHAEAHWNVPAYYKQHVTSVLVLVQDKSGRHHGDEGLFDRVEQRFTNALIDRGYNVATRDKFQLIQQEMKLQGSGLTTDEGAARLGKIANVSAVLLVTINQSKSDRHTEMGTVTSNEQVGYSRKGKPVYRPVERQQQFTVQSAEGGVSARMVSIETATTIWTANHTESANDTADSGSVIETASLMVATEIPPKDQPPLPPPPAAPNAPSGAAPAK